LGVGKFYRTPGGKVRAELLSRTGVNYSGKSVQFYYLTIHQVLSEVGAKRQRLIDLSMAQIGVLASAKSEEHGNAIQVEFTRLEEAIRTDGRKPKQSKQQLKTADGLKSFLNSSIDKGFSGLGSIFSAIQKATVNESEQ